MAFMLRTEIDDYIMIKQSAWQSSLNQARFESLGCAFGLRRTIKATLPIF